jgi:hypothetical protein
LQQATFACRLRSHATSKFSPFYLLYGIHPRLPEDPIEDVSQHVDATIETLLQRHKAANEARIASNAKLVDKANQAKLVRDIQGSVLPPIQIGRYVLVRSDRAKKLRPKWYGPYKVVMVAPIGTYALEDYHGQIIKTLIHGSRLAAVATEMVDKSTGKWKSNWTKDHLSGDIMQDDVEFRDVLKRDTIPGYTYKELSTITKKEWIDLISRGLDKSKLGEGKVGNISYKESIFQKLRARVEALERKEEKEAQQEERADESPPISTTLPKQITHSLERIMEAQTPIQMATSLRTSSAQVDVPTIERPQGESSTETEEGGEPHSQGESCQETNS